MYNKIKCTFTEFKKRRKKSSNKSNATLLNEKQKVTKSKRPQLPFILQRPDFLPVSEMPPTCPFRLDHSISSNVLPGAHKVLSKCHYSGCSSSAVRPSAPSRLDFAWERFFVLSPPWKTFFLPGK